MPCRSPTTARAPSFERLDGPAADPSAPQNANVAWITDGYLESMGVPLLAGRAFTARDTAGTDRVVIINRRLARQVFGEADPIGRLVRVGNSTQAPFQVVGVVGDERHTGIDTEATASFFVAYRQVPAINNIAIVVRTAQSPAPASSAMASLFGPLTSSVTSAIGLDATGRALRAAVRRLDPELALFQVRTMEQVVDNAVATPRSMAWLLSVFAMSALTAGGDRRVWRDEPCRQPAHARDRCADGHWREPVSRARRDPRRGTHAGRLRIGARRRVVAADRPIAGRIALWRIGVEHRTVSDRGCFARHRVADCVPRAGAPRDADRSSRCIARGLMMKDRCHHKIWHDLSSWQR